MSKTDFDQAEREQIAGLAALPDEAIDLSDIPEAPDANWLFARRGEFYRPLKTSVTIRLDADVLGWLKAQAGGRGYQTEINRILRDHVLAASKRG